uniref:Uncharacterized protein n=1 Tax=Manihot esculenta TaxID=3983 RepID=A0A2C9VJF3_MANES
MVCRLLSPTFEQGIFLFFFVLILPRLLFNDVDVKEHAVMSHVFLSHWPFDLCCVSSLLSDRSCSSMVVPVAMLFDWVFLFFLTIHCFCYFYCARI